MTDPGRLVPDRRERRPAEIQAQKAARAERALSSGGCRDRRLSARREIDSRKGRGREGRGDACGVQEVVEPEEKGRTVYVTRPVPLGSGGGR